MTVENRITQFNTNLLRVRDLANVGKSLESLTKGLVVGDDHYRSVFVQAVSALDSLIHSIVLDLTVDVLMGRRNASREGRSDGLPLEIVANLLQIKEEHERESYAKASIATDLAKTTMQTPDDIAKCLSRVGVPKIWSSAFLNDAHTTKTSLSLVVRRRNKIVHQSDTDATSPEIQTPISFDDAHEAIRIVERIGQRIHTHVLTCDIN